MAVRRTADRRFVMAGPTSARVGPARSPAMTRTHSATDSTSLNLLDELFLNLDRGEEPWNVHVEVRVSGRLEAERLVDAIREAAQRHPIARASLASWRSMDRSYRWEIAAELDVVPLSIAVCPDDPALATVRERLLSSSPSLATPPPFRIVLAHGPIGDSILLNLHHAAGDGIGAMRLMRSILNAYAAVDDPLAPLDPLAVRDVRSLAGARSPAERVVRAYALQRHVARQWGPPTRVARDGGRPRPGYGAELHSLSLADTRALIAGRPDGTTVNDVLLAALAVAIRRWNAAHLRATHRITLSMPVNLRPPAWRTEVVGNFASYVTVSLGTADGLDLPHAIEAVGEQTRAIKRDGVAGLVVDLLVATSRLTIAAKRLLPALIPLTGDLVVDSASLSDLGVLDALPPLGGDAGAVEAVWFSPPGRMPLGAAFGVATLDGRLHLCLRYRHAQFDHAAAVAFARLYRECLLP
jgi:NRPS condensation-like uncharacterized protein